MQNKNLPWGVNRLGNMLSSNVYTEVNGRSVRAVPEPYSKNWPETLRSAWWVVTGRAEAVIWPQPGELEFSLSGQFEAGRMESRSRRVGSEVVQS